MNRLFWRFYTRARYLRGAIWLAGTAANGLCSFFYTHFFWVCGEPFLKMTGRRPSGVSLDLKRVQSILVIRLDKIGDFVMTTPLLRELRHNAPQARISLLISASIKSLAERCPYVDEVLLYGESNQGLFNIMLPPVQPFFYAQKFLWKKRFDLALSPRWGLDLSRSAYLAYFSGAKWRVGYSEFVTQRARFQNCGQHLLLSHACRDTALKHSVEHGLALLAAMGGTVHQQNLELWNAHEDAAYIDALFRNNGILSTVKPMALCPGAGMPKRIWPLKNFIAAAEWFQSRYALPVIVIGGPEDFEAGEQLHTVEGKLKIINLCGKLSLPQTYALLKRCAFYLGGDTGPMHMAAAAGISVVEISCHPQNGAPDHDNAPARVGPWCDTKIVLRPRQGLPPCRKECDVLSSAHCITRILVEEVKGAVETFMGSPERTHSMPESGY